MRDTCRNGIPLYICGGEQGADNIHLQGTEGHMDVYSVYSNIQRVQRGRTGTLELAQTSHNR